MSAVNVVVNGRSYSIACNDGEEAHLRHLAAIVDAKLTDLVAMVGQIGDTRLLLMGALVLADELDGLTRKLADGGQTVTALQTLNADLKARADAAEGEAAAALEAATARVENLMKALKIGG